MIEDQLRELATMNLEVPTGAAARAWRVGRRRRRATLVAGGTACAVVAGGAVSLAVGGGHQHTDLAAVEPGPSATAPTASPSAGKPLGATPDPALDAVALPDPAPGFPYRRQHDLGETMTTFDGATVPARAWLVAARPDRQQTLPGGAVESVPGGDQATVTVSEPGGVVLPDVGTTVEALGCPARVTESDGEAWVYVEAGGFVVSANGLPATGGDPGRMVPALVRLIDSLENVPSGSCG